MKKLLVFMMALVMTLSFGACGGEDAANPSSSVPKESDSIDLVEVTANELSCSLPSDIEYLQTDKDNGAMLYANKDGSAVVAIGVKTEDSVTSADITDEVLLSALSEGGLSDATLDSSSTVAQHGGTSVVGFGKGTLEDGTVMNSVIQYFFSGDGGSYHAISYLYAVDGKNSLDDTIKEVLSTVKTSK